MVSGRVEAEKAPFMGGTEAQVGHRVQTHRVSLVPYLDILRCLLVGFKTIGGGRAVLTPASRPRGYIIAGECLGDGPVV